MFTIKALGHGSEMIMVFHFLDESIEKSMNYSLKVFWRSKALSVNPNETIKKSHNF